MRCLALLIISICTTGWAAHGADAITFWDTPRHGANCFNEAPPDEAYLRALRTYGATWVRLTFSKWKSARGGDFLFGDLDDYQALVPEDLAVLRAVLDRAQTAGLKVVLTTLALPGSRWRQQNAGRFDDRLWSDMKYWRQSAAFWRDLAGELAHHPAIVAYNLLNEPAPELRGGLDEHAAPETMRAWYMRARGSARDLPGFYATLITAVRAADSLTPIMLDAGYYAA